MKKVFIVILSVGLFFSCDTTYYSVLITNDSTKTVSYAYNGHTDTLNVSEEKTYDVLAYTQPPGNIVDQNGIASIQMTNSQGERFTFSDAEYLSLKVINNLPVDITIKAGNFIDNDGSMELTIKKDEEKTANIYTRNPGFSTTCDYPVIFDWNIVGNEMFVIVR